MSLKAISAFYGPFYHAYRKILGAKMVFVRFLLFLERGSTNLGESFPKIPRGHVAVSHMSCVYIVVRSKRKKVKADIALAGNPISELRDVTCHMEPHSATCHPTQVNAPRQTPAMQAGTQFTYPGGIEG